MLHLSQYNTCACGNRKLKRSARCNRCYQLRAGVALRARALALAAARGEMVVVVAEETDDLVRLGRAVQALRVSFASSGRQAEAA